jgi:hypothetical protein
MLYSSTSVKHSETELLDRPLKRTEGLEPPIGEKCAVPRDYPSHNVRQKREQNEWYDEQPLCDDEQERIEWPLLNDDEENHEKQDYPERDDVHHEVKSRLTVESQHFIHWFENER